MDNEKGQQVHGPLPFCQLYRAPYKEKRLLNIGQDKSPDEKVLFIHDCSPWSSFRFRCLVDPPFEPLVSRVEGIAFYDLRSTGPESEKISGKRTGMNLAGYDLRTEDQRSIRNRLRLHIRGFRLPKNHYILTWLIIRISKKSRRADREIPIFLLSIELRTVLWSKAAYHKQHSTSPTHAVKESIVRAQHLTSSPKR